MIEKRGPKSGQKMVEKGPKKREKTVKFALTFLWRALVHACAYFRIDVFFGIPIIYRFCKYAQGFTMVGVFRPFPGKVENRAFRVISVFSGNPLKRAKKWSKRGLKSGEKV